MTDKRGREIVLQYLYDHRRNSRAEVTLDVLESEFEGDERDLKRILGGLFERGLIKGTQASDGTVLGARISQEGIDSIEGEDAQPAIQHTTTYNIEGSSNFQAGNFNTQHITQSLQMLIEQIEQSDLSEEEKSEAKGWMRRFLQSPWARHFIPTAGDVLSTIG